MIPEEGNVLLDPDRRYWRRSNRQVRRARRTRILMRWAAMGVANLGFGAILILSGASAVRHLAGTSRFDVASIEVEGTRATTPDRVRQALAAYVGRNLLEIDLNRVAADAQGDPWVAGASVNRVLPHTLALAVRERVPGALALLRGTLHLVDDTGFVMGPAGPGFAYDLPVLTGLDRYKADELAAVLARGVTLVGTLREKSPAWAAGVSEIDLSQPDRIAVTRSEPGPRILMDPDRVDRNLDDYLRLQAELPRRVGKAEYVDLRWNRRIAVLPSVNPFPTESE